MCVFAERVQRAGAYVNNAYGERAYTDIKPRQGRLSSPVYVFKLLSYYRTTEGRNPRGRRKDNYSVNDL